MELFTLSKFRYPKTIENSFSETTKCNYSFLYEHDKTYETFFKENITENFTFDEFNIIKNAYIKKICFILYVLYCKGGFFIDINVIPTKKITNINMTNDVFICVKSIINSEQLFTGIFGSSKNNFYLLNLIQKLIGFDKSEQEINSKIFYEIINKKCNKNIILLSEKKYSDDYVSTVNEYDDILFNHYYKPKISYTDVPFEIIKPTEVKNIKIGITLLVFNNVASFFSNGINQNSLYLCEILLNIGFDVYFIIEDTKLFDVSESVLNEIFYDNRFKYTKYSEILYSEFNLIITLSFSYCDLFIYNYLKYLKTKHVGYFCGNTYIIESEKILYNQHKKIQKNDYDFTINGYPKYDEIWSIPQMTELNCDFWAILYHCKCVDVPFVWSNNAIKLFCKVNNCNENELYYKNKGAEKKIAILEPNLSIMKWALPSIIITENAYRKNKLIKHLYVTNIGSSSSINDFNLEQFNKFVKSFDIVKDKKCSIETRYNTLSFMKDYADIVVSHQWGNPLNYVYFDLAWMGWPILHNAHLCKDIGYFYDNFNLIEASEKLENILTEHDKNIDAYVKHNRLMIDRFLPNNIILQQKYRDLVLKLFI